MYTHQGIIYFLSSSPYHTCMYVCILFFNLYRNLAESCQPYLRVVQLHHLTRLGNNLVRQLEMSEMVDHFFGVHTNLNFHFYI